MRFAHRVVLVTGASRGIGRAIAQQFAQEGARVAVHYHRDRAAAEATLATLNAGPHLLVQADLADSNSTAPLVQSVVDSFGRLDILVNNAGIFEYHKILEIDFAEWQEVWRRTLGTNLLGPARLMYFAAQQMVKQGGGRIINISSRGAFRGEPDAPAYGASKAGLNALSQSLAKALAPHKIYVYAVAPGWVATDMAEPTLSSAEGQEILRDSPMGRVAKPEEIAHTVLFLASEGAESLTGGIIDVNGATYLR